MRNGWTWHLPEHVDVPILVPPQKHSVQDTQEHHGKKEADGGNVDGYVQSGMFHFLGQFGVEFDPGVFPHRDHDSNNLVIGNKAVRPDRVFEFHIRDSLSGWC